MLLPSEYCLCYLTYQGYSFLSRGEETIVIAPSGELWAHLRISKNAVRVGNKLYDAQENKITIGDSLIFIQVIVKSLFFDYYSYFCRSVKKYDQYGFAQKKNLTGWKML